MNAGEDSCIVENWVKTRSSLLPLNILFIHLGWGQGVSPVHRICYTLPVSRLHQQREVAVIRVGIHFTADCGAWSNAIMTKCEVCADNKGPVQALWLAALDLAILFTSFMSI